MKDGQYISIWSTFRHLRNFGHRGSTCWFSAVPFFWTKPSHPQSDVITQSIVPNLSSRLTKTFVVDGWRQPLHPLGMYPLTPDHLSTHPPWGLPFLCPDPLNYSPSIKSAFGLQDLLQVSQLLWAIHLTPLWSELHLLAIAHLMAQSFMAKGSLLDSPLLATVLQVSSPGGSTCDKWHLAERWWTDKVIWRHGCVAPTGSIFGHLLWLIDVSR